jgi:hypothetical protein
VGWRCDEFIVGVRAEYGCWREMLCHWRYNRGHRRWWEHRVRRRRSFPMGQTGCCCVLSVDGRNACHGSVYATSCRATSWRHGDTAQGGAASLLTVGRSTLASRAALGTLGDGATPILGEAASSGTAGDTMARRLRIAVRRATASCDVAGTVPSSVRSTSHAARMVTSSGEMVGVAQWLG